MPPQNTSAPVPVPPVASTVPTPPTPSASPVPPAPATLSIDSLGSNKKFMETVKIFGIYGALLNTANAVLVMFTSSFGWYTSYSGFSVAGLIGAIVVGAIGSAVGGAIFYFVYEAFHNWIKQNGFLSGHLTDLFTFFWKPFLVMTIITGVLGFLAIFTTGAILTGVTAGQAAPSFIGMLLGWVIGFVAHIAFYYIYCKTMAAKLSPYYSW